MPEYNYICKKCGDITLKRRMSDPEFKICPNCNNEITRVYGFQGSLWNTSGAYSKTNHKEN